MSDSGSFVPTRLLDIAAFENSDDIRLVRLDLKLSSPRYVALSYCWGPTTQLPITTTTSTLENRMNRIKFGLLSQTFQDTIKLARQLGQRYLWIDSLCIIQDDKDDWAIEALAITAVYGNSIFTIFALSSQNSTGGCRVNAHGTSPVKSSRYCDINTGAGRIRLFESPPKEWHIEYGDDTYKHGRYSTHNPLRTRAWTLQERELSVRGIHFLRIWYFGNVVPQKPRVKSLGKGSSRRMISFHGQYETTLLKVPKLVGPSRLGTAGMNSQRTFRLDSSLMKTTNSQHSQG